VADISSFRADQISSLPVFVCGIANMSNVIPFPRPFIDPRVSKSMNVIARRLNAVHVAARLIMLTEFGVPGFARIWQTGRVSWAGCAGLDSPHAGDGLTDLQARMVAVAGAIAERTWSRPHAPFVDEGLMWEDFMSEPDWYLHGAMKKPQPGELWDRAARTVAKRFAPAAGDLWPALCKTARRLIEDGEITMAAKSQRRRKHQKAKERAESVAV
jgi:hypothetical protein